MLKVAAVIAARRRRRLLGIFTLDVSFNVSAAVL
jgi:hypothetical protein